MRTFNLMLLASLAIAFLAGCPASEPNCASTVGCGDDGSTPDGGDPGTGAEEGIPSDAPYCPDAAKPMRCLDETAACRSETYDCSQPAYACGGAMYTCHEFGDDYSASCCDGQMFVCQNPAAFYCPAAGACMEAPDPGSGQTIEQACPSITDCTLRAVQCDTAVNT